MKKRQFFPMKRLFQGFILLFILGITAFMVPESLFLSSSEQFKKDSIQYRFNTTRASIEFLVKEHANSYSKGKSYLIELEALQDRYDNELKKNNPDALKDIYRKLLVLQKNSILASPLIDFEEILLVNRKVDTKGWQKLSLEGKSSRFGFPSNHECNSALLKNGFSNEISLLSDFKNEGKLSPILKSEENAYLGEIDLYWDANKILLTKSDSLNWKVMEMDLSTKRIRQVSKTPDDVDSYDASYLPNGKIVFGSTANYQSVPCWHGLRKLSNLYLMNNDGAEMRRLCFDQDLDMHPTVMKNGQILFNRWDYTGINHIYLRQQMVMNPDGTAQRAIYGSNSWFPNSLYFSRETPNTPGRLVSILTGYHGVGKMGQLVVVDTKKGWHEEKGIVSRISGRGDQIEVKYYDNLVDNDWPKFATPYPLNDNYFLVSCWNENTQSVGVYLADTFDNIILLKEIPGHALLEPIPVRKSKKPPVIPDRVKLADKTATMFINNVYDGPGLNGVPKDVVKKIRIIAYHYGYIGLSGPDLIGYGGPWEVMQILGTAKVETDGSAMFKVPANVPIAFQMLDEEGRAVQLMRSWVTAMPGEFASCVGCHESPNEIAPVKATIASLKAPQKLENWYGEPRGFDFEREVQPVLNKYCISCHDGHRSSIADLRSEKYFPDYKGKVLSPQEVKRMHPEMLKATNGSVKYTPAYDELIHYIRRVGIEDDVNLLVPGEYHAETSPLIQILRKGHYGVEMNKESWDRLYTWIDLNGACHGTWSEVFPLQDKVCERRLELGKLYGGPEIDPEIVPVIQPMDQTPVQAKSLIKPAPIKLNGWPLTESAASELQKKSGNYHKTVALPNEIKIQLVKIPAGSFVMGDLKGLEDEWPQKEIKINDDYWMSACEITNAQFRQFRKEHDSHNYVRRHERDDDRGRTLNDDNQPVVRVSWTEAMDYCKWLSEKTNMKISLPTEAQWEYACRAGTSSGFFYGNTKTDFSAYANLADKSFGFYVFKSGFLQHLILEGSQFADTLRNDNFVVTAPVGKYKPNAWGLYDMHGNAAEWVLNDYLPYPYTERSISGNKVVRGGSFFDNPKRARSSYRISYPEWQKVYNVGFRIVAKIE